MFGKNEHATTGRIVEKTKLLRAGVCGGPGDTHLVHVAWATYFASNTVPKKVFWFHLAHEKAYSSQERHRSTQIGYHGTPELHAELEG